jgi:hypothetical protein
MMNESLMNSLSSGGGQTVPKAEGDPMRSSRQFDSRKSARNVMEKILKETNSQVNFDERGETDLQDVIEKNLRSNFHSNLQSANKNTVIANELDLADLDHGVELYDIVEKSQGPILVRND